MTRAACLVFVLVLALVGLAAEADPAAAARRLELKAPPAGETVTIRTRPGDRYLVRFDLAAAEATVEDLDLVLALRNGARIVLAKLGDLIGQPNAPVFVISGREIPAQVIYIQAVAPGAGPESGAGPKSDRVDIPSDPGRGRSLSPPEREAPDAEPAPRVERRAPAPQGPVIRGPTRKKSAQRRAVRPPRERLAPRADRPMRDQPAQREAEPPLVFAPPEGRQIRRGGASRRADSPDNPESADNLDYLINPDNPDVPASAEEPLGADEPVYNVEVENKLSAAPLVLAHGQATRVSFGIGPRAAEAVVPAIPAGEVLERLAAGAPLTLTVTLDCLVCREDTYASTEIVYDPDARRSDTAVFEIRPARQAVAATRGYGLLVFTVDASGLDLVVIKIPTFVDAVPAGLSVAEIPAVSFVRPEMAGAIGPDLVIDIGSGAGKLPLGLHPVNPELREHMHAALPGQPWPNVFESGVTQADLSGIVAETYKGLRGIVEQNDAALRTAYGAQGLDIALSAGAARLRFEDRDRELALEQMKRYGAFLYRRVFIEGDRRLRRVIKALHDYAPDAGRPLRVRIRAADVYAPWQMLYSARRGQPAVAEGFWGFRYEMGTLQKVNASQAPARTYLPVLRPDDILLGAWRGTDEVGQRAGFLRAHMGRKLGGPVPAAHSGSAFLSAIRQASETLKLIVFYGHASSGTVVRRPEAVAAGALSLPPTLATDWTGERLMFADDDHLVPLQIDELIPDDVFDDELNPVFLKQHPIVLLNACETGTGGTEPMNNNGFIGRLTMAGAGAVFVTEAPVWRNFAYQFGVDLLDGIAGGQTMQAALHAARNRHLRIQNNPLGLLYSLYGNPSLRIAG